jgi:hypothetical protein
MLAIAFVLGLFCGHRWPANIGLAVTIAALLCIIASWYVDHSPDEVFDLFEDYCEKLIQYVFLPWATGSLVGALWFALSS